MSNDLDAKLRVASDLLRQGATEIEISDLKGKIVVKHSGEILPSQQPSSQVVNISVVANAAAQATATSYVQQLNNIKQELIKKHPNLKDEIENRLEELDNELKKPTPSKRFLRKFIKWACQFDWETLLKLVTIILGVAGVGS